MDAKENANKQDAKLGEVEGGRWVRIRGLQSSNGRKLNGKVGQILKEETTEDGRFPCKIDGDSLCKGKLIKASNLLDVPRDEMVKTYRLPARGEGPVDKTLLFPKSHSMFTQCSPNGNAPAFTLCGYPLVVERVEPYVPLHELVDKNNQRATYIMVEPHNGIAPWEWMDDVGPVVVYRPGGLDFGHVDMNAILNFLRELLDKYAVGPNFNPMTWLNPRHFEKFVQREKQEAAKDDYMCSSLQHLNILDEDVKDDNMGSSLQHLNIDPSSTFTMSHPNPSKPDLPLRAVHRLDAFGKSGLAIFYSNHLGEEDMKHHVIDHFGEVDNEMGWNANGLANTAWNIVTSPVHDDYDRANLKMGEACFNVSKMPQEVEALLSNGIITDSGKTVQIGMYPIRHPICRINLPVDKN